MPIHRASYQAHGGPCWQKQRMARTLQIAWTRTTLHRRAARQQADLRRQIELAWQTDEQPTARPTVAEEAEYVLFHLVEVVYQVLPGFYEALALALDEAYGPGAGQDLPCPLVRFGTWVGGDMDGNPMWDRDVRDTLERQRRVILGASRRAGALSDELSQEKTVYV